MAGRGLSSLRTVIKAIPMVCLLALEGWPHIPAFLKEFYPAVSKSLRFISLPVLVVSISRREGRMELSGFWFKFENESGPSVTGRSEGHSPPETEANSFLVSGAVTALRVPR